VDYEVTLERMMRSSASPTGAWASSTSAGWPTVATWRSACASWKGSTPPVKKLKYSLHPLLSSFYRRLDQVVRRTVEQADPARASFLAGARENVSLVEAIIEDGFAFTELSISEFDFNAFLASNKRYRLAADLFFEMYSVLLKETERRLRENDRGLQARVARHLPGLPKEQLQTQAGIVKVMANAQVLTYLLGDVWTTGAKLLAVEKLRAEAGTPGSAEITEVFLDVVKGVKRFELISHLRDQITLMKFGDRDADDRVNLGRACSSSATRPRSSTTPSTPPSSSWTCAGSPRPPRAISRSATSPRSSTPCSTPSSPTSGVSGARWTRCWATGS
jgi:hypothetical protein